MATVSPSQWPTMAASPPLPCLLTEHSLTAFSAAPDRDGRPERHMC